VFHFLQASSSRRYSFPLILLIICILSFGLLIPWLGFYWDDLPFVWMMNFLRPTDLILLDNNRPLSGLLYLLLFPLLRNSVTRWQLFNLANRYLLGLSAWWSFSSIFRNHRKETEWIALLLVLYPGFELQFISVNSSRHMLALVLMLTSYGLTARAAKRSSRYCWPTVIALMCSGASMLMSDYFYVLELTRPLILLYLFRETEGSISKSIKRVFATWGPYLLLLAAIMVWRFFLIDQLYYPIGFGTPDGLGGVRTIQPPLPSIVDDLVNVGVNGWLQSFHFPDFASVGKRIGLLELGVTGAVIILTAMYFGATSMATNGEAGGSSRRWLFPIGLILLGLLSMVLGGLPAWEARLPIEIFGLQSRLTLPMMMGVSFTLVGVLGLLRPRVLAILCIALAIGLASGKAIENAAEFRIDYEIQRSFFWQLHWRVPSLPEGTVILTNELPLQYETDNSLTAVVNWLYNPEQLSHELEYLMYDIGLRLGHRLPALVPGQVLTDVYRKFSTGRELIFHGTTSQALVISYDYPSCLRVIQPIYDGHMTGLSPAVVEAFDLSDPDLIQPESDPLTPALLEIYGPEPEPDWCYYYQQADLARQFGDWAAVGQWADKALALPGSPAHASEYVVFIEALGREGEFSQALELTQRVLERDQALDRMLCDAWDKIDAVATYNASDHQQVENAWSIADCK